MRYFCTNLRTYQSAHTQRPPIKTQINRYLKPLYPFHPLQTLYTMLLVQVLVDIELTPAEMLAQVGVHRSHPLIPLDRWKSVVI